MKTFISAREYCRKNGLEAIIDQYSPDNEESLDEIGYKSSKKYRFDYPCGHVRYQRMCDKIRLKSQDCPICRYNREGVGKSIQSEYPDTYGEMFDEETNGISASEVPVSSGEKYYWICPTCGRRFIGKVADVTAGHRKCRYCRDKTTEPEKILDYYCAQLDPDSVMGYMLDGYEYDEYLPKYRLLVEFDGYLWHNRKSAMANDAKKDGIALRHGYKIVRIRDVRLEKNEKLQANVWQIVHDDAYTYFNDFPKALSKVIGPEALMIDADIKRDGKHILHRNLMRKKKSSLLAIKPEIAEYLDPDNVLNENPGMICTASSSISLHFRHPDYPDLKWHRTAHELYSGLDIMPQSIKMCVKLIEKFPGLEKEVSAIGMDMKESTVIKAKCDACGKEIPATYVKLNYHQGDKLLCKDCLKKYRMINLKNSKKEDVLYEK